MKNMSVAYLIGCSILVSSATSTQSVKEWADPHDMGLSSDPKVARPQNLNPKRELSNVKSENRTTCPAELFLHRHIQRLSKVLGIDQHDMPRDIEGLLEISLNKHEASLLHSFSVLPFATAPDTLKLQALHNLEPVLEKLVSSSSITFQASNNRDYYLEVVVPVASLWLENIFFVAPMIIAFSLIYCLWRGTPLWLIVLSFILISFAWEWSHMLKQVKINMNFKCQKKKKKERKKEKKNHEKFAKT